MREICAAWSERGNKCVLNPGHTGSHYASADVFDESRQEPPNRLNWRPGPATDSAAIADHYSILGAVKLKNGGTEFGFVTVQSDGTLMGDDDSWHYRWSDIEWYVPTSELAATLPGVSETT